MFQLCDRAMLNQPRGRVPVAASRPSSDRAIRSRSSASAEAGGDGAVHVGRMRDDLVARRDDPRDQLGVTRRDGGIGRDRDLRTGGREGVEQPLDPDARAVIARGVVAIIGIGRRHMAGGAERRVVRHDREIFERNDDPRRDHRPAAPIDRRAREDVRPRIQIVIHAATAAGIVEIGGVERHTPCPRYASAISPARQIHARPSAAMWRRTPSNAAMRCGWPIR